MAILTDCVIQLKVEMYYFLALKKTKMIQNSKFKMSLNKQLQMSDLLCPLFNLLSVAEVHISWSDNVPFLSTSMDMCDTAPLLSE